MSSEADDDQDLIARLRNADWTNPTLVSGRLDTIVANASGYLPLTELRRETPIAPRATLEDDLTKHEPGEIPDSVLDRVVANSLAAHVLQDTTQPRGLRLVEDSVPLAGGEEQVVVRLGSDGPSTAAPVPDSSSLPVLRNPPGHELAREPEYVAASALPIAPIALESVRVGWMGSAVAKGVAVVAATGLVGGGIWAGIQVGEREADELLSLREPDWLAVAPDEESDQRFERGLSVTSSAVELIWAGPARTDPAGGTDDAGPNGTASSEIFHEIRRFSLGPDYRLPDDMGVGDILHVAEPGLTSWTDESVERDARYAYSIVAVEKALDGTIIGRSKPTTRTDINTTDDFEPPLAVSNLVVRRNGDGIVVTWEASPSPDLVKTTVWVTAGAFIDCAGTSTDRTSCLLDPPGPDRSTVYPGAPGELRTSDAVLPGATIAVVSSDRHGNESVAEAEVP